MIGILLGIVGLVVGAAGGAFAVIVYIADAMDGEREED